MNETVRVKANNEQGYVEIKVADFDPEKHEQLETDFHATHNDEYAGQGGAYEIKDGKRVLVHRTLSVEEAAAAAGKAVQTSA